MKFPKTFGSSTKTGALLILVLLEDSYEREIARILGSAIDPVQKALDSLADMGFTVSQLDGKIRRVRLNKNYFAYNELRSFLSRLAEGMPELERLIMEKRRRPRKRGKAV